MSVDRHLILQELTLRPSGEWSPRLPGWVVVRVVEGVGYGMQGGNACEFNPGDGLLIAPGANFVLRASQLGLLKVEYFLVQPQLLNGVLTMAEGHQMALLPQREATRLLVFTVSQPLGQKFARLAALPHRDSLPVRSALLQLWSQAVAALLPATPLADHGGRLYERFQMLVSQMSDMEFATCSLAELAGQLHCSERHLSRIFRQEFGVSLRSRQTELRLQRARQLLADANTKIINVAYESGYRHLGLFNSMFKKRFGMTPSEWRQQNLAGQPKGFLKRAGMVALWLCLSGLLLVPQRVRAGAEGASQAATAATAKPEAHFQVEKYVVTGNSVLTPEQISMALTNVPEAFGTNVTFTHVRKLLGELQTAYRERGFVTVSVGLPPQKLTNQTLKVKVTEGRLADIQVQGNKWFSTPNVLAALPSLETNMLLNSHVFQHELDQANENRNRQIYPVIGPGPEPGTSELTLKVKDRLPLHARVEINNIATPNTPDSRVAFNAQYDNLWQLEHQVGVSYNFTPVDFSRQDLYKVSELDDPLIANYSGFYRMPLGPRTATQQQIDHSNGHFGYNEVTHQFQLPPTTGRPELTFYASRASSDTGVQYGTPNIITAASLLQLGHNTASETLTLNENIGFKFSQPLPPLGPVLSTVSLGGDFKRYRTASANVDLFYELISTTNSGQAVKYGQVLYSAQSGSSAVVDYFPVNLGWNGSAPDPYGSTFFNVQANFNLASVGSLSQQAYSRGVTPVVSTNSSGVVSTNTPANQARDNFLTVQAGASREQRIYRDWTVLLKADGQWSDTPLISNEQYGMGGATGVRGYQDGDAYGDTGWRVGIEPRTPLMNIGMVDGDLPFWVRMSVFMDYGEIYWIQKVASVPGREQFWGYGTSLTANIGNHLDARVTLAFPLLASQNTPADSFHFYFGVGAQF